MSFGENQQGNAYAFTTFSPFKSFSAQFWELVIFWLAHADAIQSDVRARKFLHYAYFARVTPRALRRVGVTPWGAGLATWLKFMHGGLLFNSSYNGDAEVYFQGFSNHLAEHMNDLWKTSVGWTNAYPYENLRKFIGRFHRDVGAHVNAYPATAIGVRDALEVRNAVDDLMAVAVSSAVTDDAFQAEFRRVAMQLWGNP